MPTPQKNGICLFLMVIVYYFLTGTGSGFPPTSHIRLEKPTFVISPMEIGISYIKSRLFLFFALDTVSKRRYI